MNYITILSNVHCFTRFVDYDVNGDSFSNTQTSLALGPSFASLLYGVFCEDLSLIVFSLLSRSLSLFRAFFRSIFSLSDNRLVCGTKFTVKILLRYFVGCAWEHRTGLKNVENVIIAVRNNCWQSLACVFKG